MIQKIFLFTLLFVLCQHGLSIEGKRKVVWSDPSSEVEIPVHWEITRSDFRDGGIVTETENFREQWSLRFEKGSGIVLVSPHGSVLVSESTTLDRAWMVPKTLVTSEVDFSKLLGVEPPKLPKEEEGSVREQVKNPLISLQIQGASRGQNFTLMRSGDEYYQVRLVVGRQKF